MRNEEYMEGILGALGVGEDKGVPEPAWRHEEYLKQIYDAIKAKDAGGIAYDKESNYPPGTVGAEMTDLNGRVSDLEDNPVSPEDVQAAVNNYMDDHPELTLLGFYRDSDGDLCESDE